MSTAASQSPDVVLIGAGIMSATLGTVLKELEPALEVVMFETLQDCAQESSQAWNNAGTGHAAATRMITGTDIDYGALTHLLVSQLQASRWRISVPAKSGPYRPSLCSSAQAAARFHSSRNPRSRKGTATPGSR